VHDLWQNSKKSTKKAIFLDRDGTLNVDYGYVFEPSRIHLIEGAKQAIEIFLKHNFLLFLLTNQSGIERKIYSPEDVEACNRRLMELLGNPYFTEICIAPEAVYSPEGYRKPSPRFINEIVGKYQLDRGECYMIGDKETDAFTGINAGINGVLLESNYPKSPYCLELIDRKTILIFKNLIAFAQSKFGDNT
jgi:HAD superfamily hydrolase (TIGR01662 family)